MNVSVSGPASSSERTYLHNALTEVLSDVTTMDGAREALSLGGDVLLGYPQFSEVDLKLAPPFLSRNATVPKMLAKLANVPILSRLIPKRLHKPTAIASYSPPKKASGRIFCGASDGRFIGEVVGSAHLGVSMGSASVSYDPLRNMVEGNLEACRLNPLHVSTTKHILIRKEEGQRFSNYQSLFNTILGQSESMVNSRDSSTISTLSDTQVEALPLKVSDVEGAEHNCGQKPDSLPFTTELSLTLAEITRDIPATLSGTKENSYWGFASPEPACRLSQLDDVSRSLRFCHSTSRSLVFTQRNTFIAGRCVWESASHRRKDAPLDKYLKIGRQILSTKAPLPNTSIFFGVEPFSRFHFGRTATNRRLSLKTVTGLRAEMAATTSMCLSPNLMLLASGSIHATESIDRKRVHSLIKRLSSASHQNDAHNNYNHDVLLSKLTKSEVEENIGDSTRSKLRGFAQVMSPASFSYVKNELLNVNNNPLNYVTGYTYTPIHDSYDCIDSSRLKFTPTTMGMHMGNGLLARTHLMGIWRPPFQLPMSKMNSLYLLAGIEAAILKESPVELVKDLSHSGVHNVIRDSLEYAAYTGVHFRTPIPITATISIWSSRVLTMRQRLVFGFSLKT